MEKDQREWLNIKSDLKPHNARLRQRHLAMREGNHHGKRKAEKCDNKIVCGAVPKVEEWKMRRRIELAR
jgi:hypothetical protein